MKRFIAILLLLCTLSLLAPAFASCAKDKDVVTLYIYNWGEYISDGSDGTLDVNLAFEEWYNSQGFAKKVKINYSTFSSNESMYAKLSSGASNYDIVIPSDYMIARMISEGMLRELNFANIPNHENIDYARVFKDYPNNAPYYDTEKKYSVPYTYGTVGLIYNTEVVDPADLDTWDLLWNADYTGNILQFNNSRDAFATALYRLGYSVNTTNEAEWREALQLLKEQKALVQSYVMDEIFNKMKSNSAAIAPYYAGDFFAMYADNPQLGFSYPTEGSNIFVDAMCIPKSSKNPEIAEAYINFMLGKEAAQANAEYICYASPNKLLYNSETGLFDEDYAATMTELHEDALDILYMTDGIPFEAYGNLPPEQLSLLNSLWEELKIESSVSNSIYILAFVILIAGIAAAVFFFVRARKRRRIVETLWNN